ncbi:DUF1740-domain-containing protein [Xylaria bambusicola]|uniref:DUF1740-domain-containing protein n=1 Tax=Xylaria bambusicola TaxID=326684 RepID=UPI002007645D|nr:DUF1740-domain-containing protein [Xylaria bambusicola]KAI0526614.1 DUF1740-domain-containing protein [Xylaria bambusicola]
MSTDEKTKRSSVPRFSSFKPKSQHVVEPIADTGTAKSRPPEYHDTHISRRRHSPIQADVPSRPANRPPRGSQKQPNERELDRNPWYYSDMRGDDLILRYGSNDRRGIPVYSRIGAGRVLGGDGFMRIEKLGSRDMFFIRSYYETSSLLSSDKKNLLAKGIHPSSKPIRVRPGKSESGASTDDYLPLGTSRKRKRGDGASEESSDDEGPSYRSIHGKTKAHECSDSDEELDNDASGDVLNENMNDPLAMGSIELTRKVRQHPEDLESWLELVDLQNSLLDLQTGTRAPTAAEMRSFADIKLSLLEQALSHIGDDSRREKLKFKTMEEGLKVWEAKLTLKKFEELMQQYPKSFDIWKLYLTYSQTTLSTCRFDEIKRLYVDKIRSIGTELFNLSSVSERIECARQIIYVFARLTRFLADAGFGELALAAWQATLDLNLVRPSTVPGAGWEIPLSFQEYWESEVPRLGEDHWRGWANWVNNPTSLEPPAPATCKPPILPSTRDGYKAWYTTEHHRAQHARIPARTLDEGAEDDPYRVVMFSDLEGILLYFPTDIVPQIQSQLVDAFLVFCHVPPGLVNKRSVKELTTDPFLVRSAQDVPFTHLSSRAMTDASNDQQAKPPEFFYEIQEMALTPEVLVSTQQWFRYLGPVHNLPLHSYTWITTTLKQLIQVIRTGGLGPYSLAFESINEPGNEKKRAKALLKQDPTNVHLYLGYSILEQERKNNVTAHNVVMAALGLPSIPAHHRVLLGIRAAWLELDGEELAKAVSHLCRVAEEKSASNDAQISEPIETTPSQILKVKQFLVTNRDYKMSSGDVAEAVIYAEGLVLLDYLTQRGGKEPGSQRQGDIQSAIVRITQCSEDLVSRGQQHSASHERFLQSCAHLLYYHATHGPFHSGFLREQLSQYLTYFPSNTIFLSLFAWRETRLSVSDRVRSLLQNSTLTRANESLSSHVFAISHELRTGNAHSARAAFERALSADCCKHHVGLWIAYVRFCHGRKELRAKAKAVFYRAIQACPWSKGVFMEAFGTLVREMDSAELKSVYATMCEKGLRIHVDMDEFIEDWREKTKGVEREKGGKSRKR